MAASISFDSVTENQRKHSPKKKHKPGKRV